MHLPHVQPFAKSPLYFFTPCTTSRRPILACQAAHDILHGLWKNSATHDGWFVGRYMLMPDHAHFFAMPAPDARPRTEWLKMWKSVSARRLAASRKLQPGVWQADTFDHILRSAKSYAEKWEYVRQNPVRRGLVARPEDWPWQGEIHVLRF